MRALVYTAVRTLELQDIPEPALTPGSVKVRVTSTGICGSDIHGFLGHQARRQPGLVLGHEAVGIIIDGDEGLLGKRVSVNPLVTCGLCPACRAGRHNCCPTWQLLGLDRFHGGFTETIVVPRRNVHRLPDHVTDAMAILVEPLANSFHMCAMIPPSAGVMPTAVILGGGTLGACTLRVALDRGIHVIAISETSSARAEALEVLGAPRVLNPLEVDVREAVLELTEGRGVDVAFDCVGNRATRKSAVDVLSRGGTGIFLGLDENEATFSFHEIIRRELRLQMSFAYNESDFAEALRFVIADRAQMANFTELRPLSEGQAAFDQLIESPGRLLKIGLVP